MRRAFLLAFSTVPAIATVSATLLSSAPAAPSRRPRSAAVAPVFSVARSQAVVSSNILPGDYVGVGECRDCHLEKVKSWSTHPHSRMNQRPSAATVLGDFSGERVPMGDRDAVTFSREPDGWFMTLERDGRRVRRYLVTRTVGSRYMQFYIGRQAEGPEPGTHDLYSVEQKLPFGYWFRLRRWLPVTYFDPGPPELGRDGKPSFDPFDAPLVHSWATSCMLCHNTYPYLYRLGLREHFLGFDQRDLRVDQVRLYAELGRTVEGAAPGTVRLDPEKHLLAMGIQCESCHFGAREHVFAGKRISFLPRSELAAFVPGEASRREPVRTNPYAVNGICAQCHAARVSHFANGAATWNSREAGDLAAGGCNPVVMCTDCHDPHVPTPPAGPDERRFVAACVRCHATYAEPERAVAHSRHPGVSCLECHMPRISQGLASIVRTHAISSPADVRMFATGSANACNLCHLDRSLRWTLDELEKGWKRRIEPSPAWAAAYGGSLDTPVGKAWLEGPQPALRLVATQALARSKEGPRRLAELIHALEDPVSVNRSFAQFAVEAVLGRPLERSEYDLTASPAVRARQVERLLAAERPR